MNSRKGTHQGKRGRMVREVEVKEDKDGALSGSGSEGNPNCNSHEALLRTSKSGHVLPMFQSKIWTDIAKKNNNNTKEKMQY